MCVLAVIPEDAEDWIIVYKSWLSPLMELCVHILPCGFAMPFGVAVGTTQKCVCVCVCVSISET